MLTSTNFEGGFVAAQGNSIRASGKHWEDIASDFIPGPEIPLGTPLVYELEADLKPLPNELRRGSWSKVMRSRQPMRRSVGHHLVQLSTRLSRVRDHAVQDVWTSCACRSI